MHPFGSCVKYAGTLQQFVSLHAQTCIVICKASIHIFSITVYYGIGKKIKQTDIQSFCNNNLCSFLHSILNSGNKKIFY